MDECSSPKITSIHDNQLTRFFIKMNRSGAEYGFERSLGNILAYTTGIYLTFLPAFDLVLIQLHHHHQLSLPEFEIKKQNQCILII